MGTPDNSPGCDTRQTYNLLVSLTFSFKLLHSHLGILKLHGALLELGVEYMENFFTFSGLISLKDLANHSKTCVLFMLLNGLWLVWECVCVCWFFFCFFLGDESSVGLRSSDLCRDFFSHAVLSTGLAGQRAQSLPGQKWNQASPLCQKNSLNILVIPLAMKKSYVRSYKSVRKMKR